MNTRNLISNLDAIVGARRIPREMKKERQEPVTSLYALTQFAFGRILEDKKFVSECTTRERANIVCDMERREVRLTLDRELENSSGNGDLSILFLESLSLDASLTVIASYSPHVIHRILDPREANSPVIFLSAKTFPSFKSETTSTIFGNGKSRIQGLSRDKPMPPGSFSLMCTFRNTRDRDEFVYTCRTHLRIRHTHPQSIRVVQGNSRQTGGDLKPFLIRLPFAVAFELERAVNNLVMSVNDAISLQGKLLELSQTYPDHAAFMLSKFVTYLEEEGSIRRRKRSGHRQHITGDHSLMEKLQRVVDEYVIEQQKPRNRLAPSDIATSYTYHLTVTPTRNMLEGPRVDKSNSILRKFGNHECFLRVSFRDEGGWRLQKDLETSIRDLLAVRYQPILLEGCLIAGRHYQFLGYSMSGLKEHSMWFVTPFKDAEGKIWDAVSIRNSLVRVLYMYLLNVVLMIGRVTSLGFSVIPQGLVPVGLKHFLQQTHP